MAHSDPIADLFTRIRNGCQARLDSVNIPHSKIKEEIVKVLRAEGYVADYEVTDTSKFPEIKVALKYNKKGPAIQMIRRVSKPGHRVYRPSTNIKAIRSGLGTLILSTNQGVMTDREARKRRIGGEVLGEMY